MISRRDVPMKSELFGMLVTKEKRAFLVSGTTKRRPTDQPVEEFCHGR